MGDWFRAGRVTTRLTKHLAGPLVLAVSALTVLAAFVVFASARRHRGGATGSCSPTGR
jgi:hypothetical protein